MCTGWFSSAWTVMSVGGGGSTLENTHCSCFAETLEPNLWSDDVFAERAHLSNYECARGFALVTTTAVAAF